MHYPKSENKIHGAFNTKMVSTADTKVDAICHTLTFSASLSALDHLWLHVKCYYFSTGSDNLGKSNSEIP